MNSAGRKVLGFSLALALTSSAWAGVGVCGFYKKTFETEIVPKIQAGVPFELMATLFEDGHLIAKKVVHLKYNLWDEVVTLRAGEQILGNLVMSKIQDGLCEHLEITESPKPSRKYTYRLLLNPMWGERMARLKASTGTENFRIMGINWKTLADDMPSEKILLEKDVTL